MAGDELVPSDFSGVVRLFPLPDLVMFPHVVQPLRVFEPRYVAMLEHALADDQLLAMALLKPGWKQDDAGVPPIHSTVCLGRVITHGRLPNGSYQLLLAGLSRVRVERELSTSLPYRQARAALMPDRYRDGEDQSGGPLRKELLDAFIRLQPKGITSNPAVRQLLRDEIPLGMLVDVIAYAIPLPTPFKQRLLDDVFVERRTKRLIPQLVEMAKGTAREAVRVFPPAFSDN
jgi:Lon protease-like protein